MENLYRHPKVRRMTGRARRVIHELFADLSMGPEALPAQYARQFQADAQRTIADYIAGMTDRYAISEHRRLRGRRRAAL